MNEVYMCPECDTQLNEETLLDEDSGGNIFNDVWFECDSCGYEINLTLENSALIHSFRRATP